MIKKQRVTPIFIFSLPRSGSTLLQRLIGANKVISYTSEPWILLPFFYALKNTGVSAEYNHQVMAQGIKGFTETIDSNGASFKQELKLFAERLYQKASADDAVYFIDKTPRYHYIVNEILEVFKDAKFIFLWRNPLAIQASCIETWCSGKWNTHLFKQDQYQGLANLISAYEKHKDKCWAINYEDLVTNPEITLKPLFENYLKLEFDSSIINNFNQIPHNEGLGDKTGTKKYTTITDAPLMKWQQTMSGVIRKRWCHHYLQWLGKERLKVMGYELDVISKEVKRIPSSYTYLAVDSIRAFRGKIIRVFRCIAKISEKS